MVNGYRDAIGEPDPEALTVLLERNFDLFEINEEIARFNKDKLLYISDCNNTLLEMMEQLLVGMLADPEDLHPEIIPPRPVDMIK